MTDLTIAGETFNVLIEGDETNPVLVLSHPLGSTLKMWDAQIPALVKHFRVVRYDSRGHGGSIASEGPYSIEQLGRDALAVLDALGIEKTHWLGISKGGAVGQWLMINAPERIERAVLANTAAQFGTPEEWNSRIVTVKHEGMETTTDWLLGRWFSDEFLETQDALVDPIRQDLLAMSPEGYAATCAALRDMDLREGLRQIEHPVLVIAGRDDPAAAKPQTDLLAEAIANAKVVTLNTRHISNVEDPAGFTKAAVDFLTAKIPVRRDAIRKTVSPLPAARRPAGRRLARGVASEPLARRPATKTSPVGNVKAAPAKSAAKPEKKSAAKPAAVKPVAVKAAAPKAQTSKTKTAKAQASKAPAVKTKAAKAKPASPKSAAKKAPASKAQAPASKTKVTTKTKATTAKAKVAKTKASRAAVKPAKKVVAKPAVTARPAKKAPAAKKAPVKTKAAKAVAKPIAAKKPAKTVAKLAVVKTSRKPVAKAKTPVAKAKTSKTGKAPGRPAGRKK